MKGVRLAVCGLLAVMSLAVQSLRAVADESSEAVVKLLNSRSAGDPQTYAAAVEKVAKDAADGKILQQFVIACIANDSQTPPAGRVGAEKRAEYLKNSHAKIRALAEKRSNPLALYLLSLENNDARLLKRAAEGGNVQALNAWGTKTLVETYRNPPADTNEFDRVVRKCYGCFRQAAEAGDANGLYNFGMCHLNGYGCTADADFAYDCFRRAAEAGHLEAINNVGGFFRDGISVERDLVVAANWFKRSADAGNSYGQLNYALALQRGEGVEKDEKAAAELFAKASAQGNLEALDAYGICLLNGVGVERDERRAVYCFRRAAESGFAMAMDNLALCYDRGLGGLEKSAEQSMVWRVRAKAARGDMNAAAWLDKCGYSQR